MKLVRRLHLFLGVFFTPLLLFYVLTGWYQTFNPNRGKAVGELGDWTARLRSVHVDQVLPPKVSKGIPEILSMAGGCHGRRPRHRARTRVYLAFRSSRRRWTVVAMLAAGVAVPVLLLWLGQRGS